MAVNSADGVMKLDSWLKCLDTWMANNGAVIQPIQEIDRPTGLVNFLADELTDARFPPELIEGYAEVLGLEATEEFVHNLIPTRTNMRRGYFGEVAAARCLQDFDFCWIPVQKLRSMIGSDQSLPGIDVLGARLADGQFETLIFVEAKVRTTRRRRIALDASKELIADFEREFPTILNFTARELENRTDPMFRPFLHYLKRRQMGETEDLPYVFLLLERGTWQDEDIDLLDELTPLPTGFRVSVIEIDNLAQLVEAAYSAIGVGVDSNDDE